MLRIYLFGAPRVERDGKTISISRRKTMALLAYLAVTGQPHSREGLATLFWPENDPSSALANLRRDLSRLKRAVGAQALAIDRTQASLNPQTDPSAGSGLGLWLDVVHFRDRLACVRQHGCASPEGCDDCLAALTEAVELYSGDFMAGFGLPDCIEFDEWQFFQAEGLRQSLAEGLQWLIRFHLTRREYRLAIPYARRWLALDPLHEPAQRELMQLYAWSGQWTAALRQYEECVRLLDEELGVPPEPETTALYDSIKSRQLAPPEHAPPPTPTPDLTSPERYVLEEPLAEGSHGSVYRGRDRVTDQSVVIKRLKPTQITREPELVARFVREVEALRQLSHPNIVGMLALFEHDGQQHIVMEYVPGGSLRQLLEQTSQLPLEQALDIALELADALSRVHHLGIIHRDLKPENVLLATDGTPRLTDFGLARIKRDETHLTQAGAILGSPVYMSPEAARGQELDARSDIWSLGVLLYEMLAGRAPFEGDQLITVLARILEEPVPEIQQFRPQVPPTLVALLQRMLTKERDQRVASMRQVAAELEAIRAGRSIAASTGGRTPSTIPHNLPAQLTPLVGRKGELADIQQLLLDEPACRLVTLLGPGGTGKTRLALQVATQIVNEKRTNGDGLFFVRLQAVRSADGLVSAIADALDYVLRGQEPPQVQLLNYLSDKTLLLVLDNFEQLLGEGGARLVDDLLQAAPAVKLLVTSREVLGLQGEWLYPVAGLPYPDGEDATTAAEAFDAVRLFVERARQVRRDFSLATELQAVVRICQLVQGMPLAIELAASWAKTLSCVAIAAEIERNLDFLTTSLRNVPERHRSVRAVFVHSWERLTPEEREAFKRLAVFRGGFQRAAAEQVAGASLTVLSTLVDKSLLLLGPDGRYQIHELLRQYAEEQLQATLEEVVNMHSAHCAHYAAFLHTCLTDMEGGQQHEATAAIRIELENVRAAWVWAVELVKVPEIERAALPLSLFFQYQSRYLEGAQAFEKAAQYLAQLPEEEQTGRVLAVVLVLQAWFCIRLGRLEKATVAAERSQALYHRLEILPAPGFATDPLLVLGIIASIRGDYAKAARLGEQAHQVSEAQDNRLNCELAHYLLARAALAQGQYESAQQHAQWAYAITQETGDRWFMAYCLNELGNVACALHDPAAARKHYQASFALREEFDDPEGMAVALNSLGEIALRQEQYAEAERLGQQSLALYQGINDQGGLATSLSLLGNTAVAQGDYSTARERFRQALEIASQMRFVPLALTLLGGMAEWLLRAGQEARGVELLALVRSHPASDQETKVRARDRLAAWESRLAPELFTAATLRGQKADLETELEALQEVLC